MITGGKTFRLSPSQLAEKIEVTKRATDAVNAAGQVLADRWTAVLLSGTGTPVPAPRTYRLARSIRLRRVPAVNPTVSVGTPGRPGRYGRILHYGVPGRIAPRPHGDIALNVAEKDMNEAFRRVMK